MEIEVTQENLAKALSTVGRVANSKAQLPVLNNILLRTDGNRLLVAATNLEIASTQLIGAKIEKPGSLTVPARLFSEFITSLPKGKVSLKVVNESLHIASSTYKSIINGTSSEEFPELPTIDEDSSISYTIAVDDFKKAVSQTIITSSSDTTRAILTGVYVHSFDGFLYFAATDGYRLSERKVLATKSEVAAIVPTSTFQEVLRSVTEDMSEVELLFDETQVRFRLTNSEITSRLIDGNFPDYRKLIPITSETTSIVKKDDFLRTVKVASLFARNSGGSIIITSDKEKQQISIHSIASELGENTSETAAHIDNDGTITLNSRYIIDALGVIDSGEISFGFSGKLAPCVMRGIGKNSDEYTHIIMPLKS